ncbi:hypothetical protein CFC21_030602 [Triticum aestivum]|uniref:Uncharacterized protein n=2 Tax=Triticum aestivum TaxID=4565 RepID=A0A3B6DJ85_WHEAT|nr:hypothetical protein CFC21_030602 [Triticum aestivum]
MVPEHGDDGDGLATVRDCGDDGGGLVMETELGDDGGDPVSGPEHGDDGGGPASGPEHGDVGGVPRGREQASTLARDGDNGLAPGQDGHDGERGSVLELARAGAPCAPRRGRSTWPATEPSPRRLATEKLPWQEDLRVVVVVVLLLWQLGSTSI